MRAPPLLLAVLALYSCVGKSTSPAGESPRAKVRSVYQNPILAGFYPDPSVCRVGDDYYVVTSTFEYFPGVPIFHSRDLIHFRQLGHALTRPSQLPLAKAKSSEGIFAPTLRHHRGTFYLVTTNMSGGGNFIVTTRDPGAAWSEPVWIRESAWGMDPSLFFDDDGKVYYTRHGGGERGGVYQAEIDVATGKLDGEARLIWRGTGGIWPEGPHLYKRDGHYYLLISEGGTGYDHGLTVARATTPWGPFEPYAQNPILTHRDRRELPIQATGHGDLVTTSDGAWWLVFLGIRPWDGAHHHLGRETFLAPVTWSSAGWPIVNGGRPISREMDGAGLPPPHPWPVSAPRDDFAGPELGLEWNFIRNPNTADWSLAERPGFLRLHGSTTTLDDPGSPAFVGRRQQHQRCTASALLEFEPVSADQQAGLVIRANEANHFQLLITRGKRSRVVRLHTRVKGTASVVAETEVPSGPLVLGVDAHANRYEFWFATEGGRAHAVGSAPTVALATENAGGFTGAYIGLHATRAGARGMPPADFAWFDYVPGT